jgi:hypothetical protein
MTATEKIPATSGAGWFSPTRLALDRAFYRREERLMSLDNYVAIRPSLRLSAAAIFMLSLANQAVNFLPEETGQ